MKNRSFRYASLAMSTLERLLGSRFTVSGIENIPKHPVMFVANHFTRSETFFVPYIINKITKRHVRCLADSKIFIGLFGKFLKSVGTISTRDPNRDNIIINDLVTGDYDWMIYPEGSMIKSKEIDFKGLYFNYTPYRSGPVRTGASVLALKSQLYREDLIKAFHANNQLILDELKNNYQLQYDPTIENLNTHIVPVNITYYPIRPGNNKIKKLATKLIKNIPKQIIEELEIEGNILLDSIIDLNFGKAINLNEYIFSTRSIINKIPIINYETKNNFIIKYYRSKLTNNFMQKVYSDIKINFDHIFIGSLVHYSKSSIDINHLKKIIYYSAYLIIKSKKYRYDYSIVLDNIFQLFNDEKFIEFDDVFELALSQNIIRKIDDNKIEIFKEVLNNKIDFHRIRIENTLQVILHELLLLDSANSIIKKSCNLEMDILNKTISNSIFEEDIKKFEDDYQNNYDQNFSKDKIIGSPKFSNNTNNLGVLLVHGYKSAPKEVEDLANYLKNLNITTYCVRLDGHGTAPIDLKNKTWFDWYKSVNRGYGVLNNICDKIAIVGFSTGGLLGLLSASHKKPINKLVAIVSINSALKLKDIKSRMIPGINLWNEILEKFNFDKGKIEYVEDHPENPHINYSRNYIKAVYELEKLMNLCFDNLHLINTPSLIIQSKNDPVVDPISGDLVFNKINSNIKKLIKPNMDKHVILTSNRREEIFEDIINFFEEIKII